MCVLPHCGGGSSAHREEDDLDATEITMPVCDCRRDQRGREEVIAINQDNGNLVVEEEMKTNVQLRLYWRKTTNKETREETSNKILISTMSLVNARPRDISILALSERY